MFNIYLKNTVIHNLEYIYEDCIKNIEEAITYCFFYNYDIVLFFKKEKKYWFSKINPHLKFRFCENSDLCDLYMVYKIKNLINFHQEIIVNKNINNKVLFIIHGSLNNYDNNDFLDQYNLKETMLILKDDNFIYKVNKIKKDFYFIVNGDIDLKMIYQYYTILTNIKNKRYKYVICYNTDIIIPNNSKEFIDNNIDKVKSNMDSEIIISNNIQNFLFCKSSVFENFQFTNKYIIIKPSSIIFNDN